MKKLDEYSVEFHSSTLKNGSNVFIYKRKGMPIYLRLSFFAGSRFDKLPGVAHFLEHMIVAGTKKYPTKNLIADEIQRIGGELGANTDNNLLRVNIEIPEIEDIDKCIELLNECLNNSLFNKETIETERGAILSEFKAKKSNPKEYINEVQRRLALQELPPGRSTLGSEESIINISQENILDFFAENLHTGRLTFFISGDVDVEKILLKLNSINFSQGDKPTIPTLPIIDLKKTDIENYQNLEQLQASFVSRTEIANFREYCSIRVLNNILALGRGSRLLNLLRYQKGLVYTVSGINFDFTDWGTYRINLSCDAKNFNQVKEIIDQEFENIKSKGFTEYELETAKLKISKGLKRLLQTSESWINFHENLYYLNFYNNETVEEYKKTIESISLDEIQQVALRYLNLNNFKIAICGDSTKISVN